MNPDNPFAKLTDKDMLLFNPNYEAYMNKLNKNQNKMSELSRIMGKPYDAKAKEQKKEAMTRFLRATWKQNGEDFKK